MAINLLNGVRVPEGSDLSAPHTDMDKLGRSVRSVITATSESHAASLVDQAKRELGWNPSSGNPMLVYRQDLGGLAAWDGSNWYPMVAQVPISGTLTGNVWSGWSATLVNGLKTGKLCTAVFRLTVTQHAIMEATVIHSLGQLQSDLASAVGTRVVLAGNGLNNMVYVDVDGQELRICAPVKVTLSPGNYWASLTWHVN